MDSPNLVRRILAVFDQADRPLTCRQVNAALGREDKQSLSQPVNTYLHVMTECGLLERAKSDGLYWYSRKGSSRG